MMDEKEEKQETEEKKPEDSKEDTDKGDKLTTTPLIEEARSERKKLEAANDKKAELLDREEAMMMRQALSGKAEAGQQAPKDTRTPEEKDAAYVEDFKQGKVNPLAKNAK